MRLEYSAWIVLPVCTAAWFAACSPDEDSGSKAAPAKFHVTVQANSASASPAVSAADPNAALISCAAHGDVEGIVYALQEGADLETLDENGLTPLMWAAQQRDAAVVALLLERGANPQVTDNTGWTPLHCAASAGSVEGLQRLLNVCGNAVNAVNNDGDTPLLVALRMHREDIARVLVSARADINIRGKDGRNAVDLARAEKLHDLARELQNLGGVAHLYHTLMDLARDGRDDSLKELLGKTPDIDLGMQDNNGWTALTFAAVSGHTSTIALLLEAGAKVDMPDHEGATPLLYAALEGHVDAVKLLMKHGASLNVCTSRGWTPLLASIGHCKIPMVQYLLEQGVDVNQANDDGETALILAAANGQDTIVSLLLAHGARVDDVDRYGWTALMVAAAYGRYMVLELLLNGGADLERQDDKGWTPLLCAASAGSVSSLDLLVQKGANLSHTDKEKRSALVIACGLGHSRVVRYLVENCKVPVNELDNQGWTPLMHAAALGRDQVVDFLLRNGADATVKNQLGESAYRLAGLRGEKAVLHILEQAGITE